MVEQVEKSMGLCSVNSRLPALGGSHIWAWGWVVNLMLFYFVCVLGDFLGDLRFWGGEIAGINTWGLTTGAPAIQILSIWFVFKENMSD